jgi:formamidopyrimidine-DNA glycosylase
MPELPEVETTRRGIAPHIEGRQIEAVVVRDGRLRWPVSVEIGDCLVGQQILCVGRRGKYLLIRLDRGTVLAHLGMSGSLRITRTEVSPAKHDHVDLVLAGGTCLRYRDPRRFGCLLWTDGDPLLHPLLSGLGPEPLDDEFSGAHLHAASRRRSSAVKTFIMDSRWVVGVGNIYANEALFRAGIHPGREAGTILLEGYEQLAHSIRLVLGEAIEQGGTTLRDFVNEVGKPGYFQQALRVYGREGEKCLVCGSIIESWRQNQRATYCCPNCQS